MISSLSYHYGFCPDCRVSAFKYDILAADQSLAKGAFTDCVVLLTHAADRVATDSEFKVLRMVLDQVALDMKPVGVKPSPLVKQPSFFNKMKKQMSGMFKLDNDSANDGYEAEEKLDLYDDCLILTEKVIEMHAKLENNTVPDEPLTWSPAYSLSKINKPGPESVAPRSVRRLNKRRSTKAAGKGGLMKLVKHMSGIFDADTDSDEE